MSQEHTLPDSRIKSPIGTRMATFRFQEVECVGGIYQIVWREYRWEMERIYCVNCGKERGWVPRGMFRWVASICTSCSEIVGRAAAMCPVPDHEFWDAVGYEMERTYGKALSGEELDRLAERGELSIPLQLLQRETPTWK